MDHQNRFASLPSVYISDRNNNAIRVIQSPTLARSIRTQSFRTIEDSYDMKIHHKHRRRSSSDIGMLQSRSQKRSKRRGSCPTGNAPTSSSRNNPYNRFKIKTPTATPTASVFFSGTPRSPSIALMPWHFFTNNPSKRKQKWVESYFKEQPQFQSTFYFFSLKLQELLHITSSDVRPDPFRVAMACELLSNFMERTNTRRDDIVLMKRILRLVVEGIYPDFNAVTYHELIGRDSFFKQLRNQESKFAELQEEFEVISQKTVERFSGYFAKSKRRRSAKPEFAVWRTYAKIHAEKRRYEIEAQRAVETREIINIFWKWRKRAQDRKQRLLRETACKRMMVQNDKMLFALKASRRQTLALQAKQYKNASIQVEGERSQSTANPSNDLSENSSELAMCWPESPKQYGLMARLNRLEEDEVPQPENWRDMLLEYNIMRMNLKYYKRISENRNVFIEEFQQTMETRLHLEICRDRLEDYLREYEGHFGHLHHSSLLMTDDELDNPWDEQQQQSPLQLLSSEKLLLRWINYQIRETRLVDEKWRGINNLTVSLRDGMYLWYLLKALGLIKHIPDRFNEHDISSLMDTIHELGLNDGLLVTAMDIKRGHPQNTFVFLSNVMVRNSNLYLEPGHLEQDLEEMDHLYLEIESHLNRHENYQHFAFSESWLKKATVEREILVALCNKCEGIYDVIESDLKMMKSLDSEFNDLLSKMHQYGLKILSSDRRGMKTMIEDDETLQELTLLSTINMAMFSTFYKAPKSVMKMVEQEQRQWITEMVGKCEQCLKDNIYIIRRVFNEYSGRGGNHEVLSGPQLKSFCVDMRIVSTFSSYQFEKRIVLKKDFATFLSEVCYRKKAISSPRQRKRSFANMFREFVRTLWESTKTLTQIRSTIALPEVQMALQTHRLGVQQIFRQQSEEDTELHVRYITKKKWMDLMHKYGVIGSQFTDKIADQTFEVCNSDYNNQGEKAGERMIYQEFVEALLSVALMKNCNIFSPLSQRVQTFFKQLVDAATGFQSSLW